MHSEVTASELKEMLHYDPDTGEFTWLCKVNGRVPAGSKAGTLNHGYIRIRIRRKIYGAHRIAWLYMTGEWPSVWIDHKNRNPSDNRFCNLRECTRSQNLMNRTGVCNGAYWHENSRMYQAKVSANGKSYAVYHRTKEGVKAKATELRKSLHGEFWRGS